MTIEEAIKMLEYLATDTTGTLAGFESEYAEFLVKVIDALDMGIAALREQSNTVQRVANTDNALTNAQHIRSMSDEELAKFLAEVENRRSAAGGGAIWKGAAHAKEWLKQPYKEET